MPFLYPRPNCANQWGIFLLALGLNYSHDKKDVIGIPTSVERNCCASGALILEGLFGYLQDRENSRPGLQSKL